MVTAEWAGLHIRTADHNFKAEGASVINKISSDNTAAIVDTVVVEGRGNHLEPESAKVAMAFHFGACDSNSQSYQGHCPLTERNTFDSKNRNSFQQMHPQSEQWLGVR